MENTKVIAVIPLYNESRIVPSLIKKIKEWQRDYPDLSTRTFFYLFDDGSTDLTEYTVKNNLIESDRISYVKNINNSNYIGSNIDQLRKDASAR